MKEEPEAHTKEAVMTDTKRKMMTTKLLTEEEPTTTKGEKTEETEDHKESTGMRIDSCMSDLSILNVCQILVF